MSRRLFAHIPARHPPQFIVNQRHQLLKGILIAFAPINQKVCDLWRAVVLHKIGRVNSFAIIDQKRAKEKIKLKRRTVFKQSHKINALVLSSAKRAALPRTDSDRFRWSR